MSGIVCEGVNSSLGEMRKATLNVGGTIPSAGGLD